MRRGNFVYIMHNREQEEQRIQIQVPPPGRRETMKDSSPALLMRKEQLMAGRGARVERNKEAALFGTAAPAR